MYEEQKAIYDAIDLALCAGAPLLISRNGSTELGHILGRHQPEQHLINAGIWSDFDKFRQEAHAATEAADILAAGWFAPLAAAEADLLASTQSLKVSLPALEPYFAPPHLQWTRLLANKKVAVISPFADTINKQDLDKVWPDGLMSSIDFTTIRTGYPPQIAPNGICAWPPSVRSWMDAVDLIVGQVVASGAEVVLIGCGGIGPIIGARLKALGRCCIVLGGALQILFGIKGRRWVGQPIAAAWNEHWTWSSERPAGAGVIEGGCYW